MNEQSKTITFKIDEVEVMCRNIGYDITCGRCASVFFTGMALEDHDPGCKNHSTESTSEARALEDEQLRLRLAGDLAVEQRQHEATRRRLEEAHREVDGLRAERASVDAGVCQSCASAWWAREHDQNAAREQVAAAEAALRAERARASAAQVVTNAAVRDLTSAAGEIMLLREKLAAAEQDRDEVVTLLGEIRELARTRSCGPAVHDDLWAVKELADTFILRNAAPPGAAPAEAP